MTEREAFRGNVRIPRQTAGVSLGVWRGNHCPASPADRRLAVLTLSIAMNTVVCRV